MAATSDDCRTGARDESQRVADEEKKKAKEGDARTNLNVVVKLGNLLLELVDRDEFVLDDDRHLELLDSEADRDELGETPQETGLLDRADGSLEGRHVGLVVPRLDVEGDERLGDGPVRSCERGVSNGRASRAGEREGWAHLGLLAFLAWYSATRLALRASASSSTSSSEPNRSRSSSSAAAAAGAAAEVDGPYSV